MSTEVLFFIWATIAIGTGVLGASKGLGGVKCFLLGCIFGPIGLLLVAVLRPTPEVEAQRQVEVERARRRLERQGD